MPLIKNAALTACASLCIVFILNISVYKTWWNDRILYYWDFIQETQDAPSEEERCQARYSGVYTLSKGIIKFVQANKINDAVILLPPNGLIEQNGIDLLMPEPAVFYYFTRIKSVWGNSPSAQQANWAVVINKHQLGIVPLKNGAVRDSLIKYYCKFNYTL